MNFFLVEVVTLFILSLALQFVSIIVRRVPVSLMFSFLNSIMMSLMILSLGYPWLSLTSLFMFGGITYGSLIKTSLLIQDNKDNRPKRRLTFALLFSTAIVSVFIFLILLLLPEVKGLQLSNNTSLDATVISLISSEYATLFFIIAMLALPSFITALLLVRQDEFSSEL